MAWFQLNNTHVTTQDHDNPGDADFNLRFVADQHDDWDFSGEELAHAPYPSSVTHGNVSTFCSSLTSDIQFQVMIVDISIVAPGMNIYPGMNI